MGDTRFKPGTVHVPPQLYALRNQHRRRIKTEEKAKVVAVGWETYLNAAKDDMSKSFRENIHFGRGVVCYGVNRMIIHFSKASIPLSSRYSIHPFLQIILVENS